MTIPPSVYEGGILFLFVVPMRVIAGKAKGRKLQAVPGESTRPILDRVRTALFDILRPRIQGTHFLDLFGGTGSVGIEALSQGAAHCVFTELNKTAYEILKQNLKTTELDGQADPRHTDAFLYIKNTQKDFDIIYVAPPQYQGLWEQALIMIAERPNILRPGGLLVAQIDPDEYEPLQLNSFIETEHKSYGKTLLVFYEHTATS